MKVDFLYGKDGLEINISDEFKNVTVIEPQDDPPIENPIEAIYRSLRNPLSSKPLDILLERRGEGYIVIVIDDHTRPVPNNQILKALAKIFSELNINDDEIKILVGTGLHRAPTFTELKRMVGQEMLDRFDIIFHDATDSMRLDLVGTNSEGHQIYLNSDYVQAGFKIVTGYVEPHMFAGFSGGRKALVPGIASKDSIMNNHSPEKIDSINARFGVLKGNPMHEDSLESARLSKPDFCINVTINSHHEITKVGSGNIFQVHNYLVNSQEKKCFREIKGRFDIVLTGNSGYPLDLNLYQSVKSMVIGEIAVKQNGTIIAINECSNGIGGEGFEKLIKSGKKPPEIYAGAMNGLYNEPGIWEIQILSRILMYCDVYVISSLPKSDLGNIGLKYSETVEKALDEIITFKKLSKSNVNILILPTGPQSIPKFSI
jgi:nickel-dependent lactate racemase